jgi:hypothetical protein
MIHNISHHLAPLRTSTELPQEQQDHSLTYILVLLLLFGPVIGLRWAFVLDPAQSNGQTVQHRIASGPD